MKIFFKCLFLILTQISAEKVEKSVISANNQFAADIYKELVKNEEANFLVSPFSVESVFAFVQSGARGQTAEEIRTTLHLPHNQSQIEAEFKNIFPNLKTSTSRYNYYSFNSANKLYLDKKFVIKDNFKKTAGIAFEADLENVEFSKNVDAAKIINQWVEEKTEKKIRDLVDPNDLDPQTVAVIVNALYFKANWSVFFDGDKTGKKDFYHIDRKFSPVDTMHLSFEYSKFNYAENQELDAKFLELPFAGRDVSMTVALPNDKDGIADLEKQIEKVFTFDTFSTEYVNISLPKFKIESKVDVKEILQKLGVSKAFAPGEADFSGISEKNGYIDKAIQKTFISVDEKGVEAAAATYANEVPYSVGSKTPKFKEFHADHPFIYFIKVRDLIVFAGRVGAPHL